MLFSFQPAIKRSDSNSSNRTFRGLAANLRQRVRRFTAQCYRTAKHNVPIAITSDSHHRAKAVFDPRIDKPTAPPDN